MKYVANVALLIKGDRIEKGTEIELTKDEAAHFHPDDLSPSTDAPETGAGEAEEAKEIDDMNVDELKAKAKELGLAVGGTKADLLERIKLHQGSAPETGAGE